MPPHPHALSHKTVSLAKGGRWQFTLRQTFGSQHTIGRFRITLGQPTPDTDPRPIEERRHERLLSTYNAWKKPLEAQAVRWTVLTPIKATANVAGITNTAR